MENNEIDSIEEANKKRHKKWIESKFSEDPPTPIVPSRILRKVMKKSTKNQPVEDSTNSFEK